MTDTLTPESPPATELPAAPPSLAERVNRKIKAQLAENGLRFNAVEEGIGMSHAAAARRSAGANDWTFGEVEAIARWLGLEVVFEFRASPGQPPTS